jgi:hypothetical protein
MTEFVGTMNSNIWFSACSRISFIVESFLVQEHLDFDWGS